MLKNAYFLAKIGADTAENERNLSKFAKNCHSPYGSAAAVRTPGALPRSADAGTACPPAALIYDLDAWEGQRLGG